jgi:ribonuclease HI
MNSQSDQVGISMVIRDQYESVKAAQCCFCRGKFNPTTVKALAAVQAITYCNEIGMDKICLEGDAKNVVDALNAMEKNCGKFGHLIADAKVLLQKFSHWEVKFVKRDANGAAHSLMKLAAQVGLERKWRGEILDYISEIIRVEQFDLSL